MWTYYPDLLERPVPRYTSFPTAAEFTAGVGAAEQDAALRALAPGAVLSVYVHIPFCREICWYCGCNTGRSNRSHRLSGYLEALAAETRTVAARMRGRHPLSRIAFGGGSPNAISPVDFVRLLDMLILSFGAVPSEISVELDPRNFDEHWALALGRSQVSHVSLGVQTFDPDIQARIGRVQPGDSIRRAVDLLRQYDIGSINFDLMYGLPGQDIAILDRTLDEAVDLRPERVALFGYAHVPQMIPRQKRIDASHLPDQRGRFAMAAHGYRRLIAEGYVAIGFDHFALPFDGLARAVTTGRLHRNFQGFTDDRHDALIGLGASAISGFPGLHVQNEKNGGVYRQIAGADRLAGARGVKLTEDDERRATIIESLLCGRSADIAAMGGLADAAARLAPFIDRGLARLRGRRLSVTEDGLPYARTIAAQFDRFRSGEVKQFSTAI